MAPAGHVRSVARQLTGAFVLFHLVAITLGATPSVRAGLSRKAWQDPAAQAEFSKWVASLDRLGVRLTADEFEDRLWDLSVSYTDVREAIVSPFYPYLDLVGARQPWRLFTAPHRYPSRLEIAVGTNGVFEDVYVARSKEHAWMRSRFDDVRMRKAIYLFGWPRRRRAYNNFCRWVARSAALDFPDADQVRVRFWRYKIPSPEEQRAGKVPSGRFRFERVLELEGSR